MSKPITFIHTADWHIRDTQYGRRFRGDDFANAIRRAVQIAIDRKVDFIVNGGDTFHVKGPSGNMMNLLFEVHVMLKRAGIPMYTVTGNHDNTEPSYLGFPGYEEKIADLPAGRGGVVCIDHQIVDHDGVRIAGYPAIEPEELLKIVSEFPKLAKPVDIIVWHGAIQEFVGYPMPHAALLDNLPLDAAHAWLLGDIHLRAAKRLSNGVLVSYPGTLELDERGEPPKKFVDLYTLKDDWRSKPFPDPQEIPTISRPVIFLQVNDDAQADQALGKIRTTLEENPDFPPMIFMRYSKSMKAIVRRVMELIDLRTTVFKAGVLTSAFEKGAGLGGNANARPDIANSVSAVVPPGTAVFAICLELSKPGINHRQILNEWVDRQLMMVDGKIPEPSLGTIAGFGGLGNTQAFAEGGPEGKAEALSAMQWPTAQPGDLPS
jgi:hypothetical protein